ncbi:Pycsar system effector family protein [Actinoplanes sp. NPDC026623]|uniref:Pycsar system effector family protein n=1 Tax=Actinoplanes sp. NPDC026623 TaxID=3155610 RepID=UPI0034038CF9
MLPDTTAPDPSTTALTDVQTQMSRVDIKASILFGLSLGALTGTAAVISKTHLPGPAVIGAAVTVALIGAALALLGAAIRPALAGNHGFVRWAAAPSPADLADDLHTASTEADTDRAAQLWGLSRAVHRKYRRVRLAVDLLGLALGSAALTVLLTATA